VVSQNASVEDVTGAPTAVVTGASSGIGTAAAVALARLGWRVALVGRSPDRLDAALSLVRRESAGPKPLSVIADFTSFESVRRAALVLRKLDRIDLLANNAGVVARRRAITVDGNEVTIQTNHLSPFLLTNLLRDWLEPGARIVTTASVAHSWCRLDVDDLSRTKSIPNVWLAYGASKAANVLFAAEAARRWPDLLSFSFHPGIVRTNFGTPTAQVFYRLAPGMRTPEQGADTLVYLATAPAAELVNGAYYDSRKPVRPRAYLADPALGARLWERSLELIDS
jgi:NAD(P)-dependent dehydrogenase (short-subunit alcohol dehydrogenase family)